MSRPTIWVMSLEPIETRYTAEWHEHIPKLLNEKLGDQFDVAQIDGVQRNTELTPGAFLNFADTNYWKSSQLCNFLEQLSAGKVGANDHIIFTDAWNPVVIQLKYMKELLGYKWKLHGLWHAGSYDKWDFLGRLIGNAAWVRDAEKSMFNSYDHNHFATNFHIDMFCQEVWNTTRNQIQVNGKIVRTGWPMEYLPSILSKYRNTPKKNQIVFPHRIAPEKQLDIFKDLAHSLPEYSFVVCQEQKLTKEEYHKTLAESKIVFSASLQETLGIGVPEGMLVGALPLVPNRLSYTEMYPDWCKYPSDWTDQYDFDYNINRLALCERIKYSIENYDKLVENLNTTTDNIIRDYFSCGGLLNTIKGNV